MCSAAYFRYINFYGQKGARLTNDQTIYGFKPSRTHLIKTLSIFLFYAPELHLRGTHGHRVIRLHADPPPNRARICLHGFRHLSTQMDALFITRLQSDWTEFVLYVRSPRSLRCGVSHTPGIYRGSCC